MTSLSLKHIRFRCYSLSWRSTAETRSREFHIYICILLAYYVQVFGFLMIITKPHLRHLTRDATVSPSAYSTRGIFVAASVVLPKGNVWLCNELRARATV
jgi:hypothetical protein